MSRLFAESNFGSTATIRVEDVRDDGGGLVPDFTLQTESGATNEAPEPGRALLLATGVAVLAGLRRRPWARPGLVPREPELSLASVTRGAGAAGA